jgi:microcystin-dependent protein
MSQPFLGEIRIMANNFAPRSWAYCNGQLLPIAQNSALFSLLGTTFGGNGQTTFALPNLQGRAPMAPGNGPGLTPRSLGESGGSESVTLLSSQMPSHSHGLQASAAAADRATAQGARLAQSADAVYASTAAATQLAGNSTSPAGGSQPHGNMQPFLAIGFVIALQGIFPSRP